MNTEYDHELKTIQPFFDMVWNDYKPYEIRVNDRNFKQGQHILLREYYKDRDEYGDRSIVIHVLSVTSIYDILVKVVPGAYFAVIVSSMKSIVPDIVVMGAEITERLSNEH